VLDNAGAIFHQFPEAVLASLTIASVCSLLGVFTILKRVVFIGITLSEVAACGIAAGMLYGLPPFLGAGAFTLVAVVVLAYPFEMNRIPRDAVLGVVFVLASSLSIVLVSRSGFGLHEVKALLYGDIVLTSRRDLQIILGVLLPVLAYLLLFIRPTLYTFLDREAARLLGVRIAIWELLYFLALCLAVSAASKVAGALLIFCHLVVAPAAALLLFQQFWLVMATALIGAVIPTLIGLYWSFSRDLPANQIIALTSCIWFGLCMAINRLRRLISGL
jgi:ABC-type Mn2+/Zn2+ transport system permease subunit